MGKTAKYRYLYLYEDVCPGNTLHHTVTLYHSIEHPVKHCLCKCDHCMS